MWEARPRGEPESGTLIDRREARLPHTSHHQPCRRPAPGATTQPQTRYHLSRQRIDRGNAVERKPHAHRLRAGRYSQAGRIYLVTTVTRHRRPVFRSLPAARCLIRTLQEEQRRGRADTLAFVVMPDHLHWLLQLAGPADLSQVIQAVKSVTAHRIGGKIWQDGFHDHALRKDENLLKTARYIVANPLRAGLVTRLGDYPHWDAIWL